MGQRTVVDMLRRSLAMQGFFLTDRTRIGSGCSGFKNFPNPFMLVRLRTVQRCRLPPIRRFLSNPAFATNPVPHPDYPPFIARVQQTPGTLQGTTRFTVLPTPLPQDSSSPANDVWFTDSTTQELIAVIDACLHNLYDVPRAKQIFDRLRKRSSNVLEPRIYNSMLESYVAMASATDDAAKPKYWLEEAWRLYQTMESSTVDKIAPTASTYALMLLAWLRCVCVCVYFYPSKPYP